MKVLVFDDSQVHRNAAQAQLGDDHDLTVVSTYDEAQGLLVETVDEEEVTRVLEDQFGDFKHWQSDDEEKKVEYFAAYDVAYEKATTYPDFDVVLTDLLVPASGQSQGSRELVEKEMPLGTTIALLAMKSGVKMVGVITDANHHSHPASAALDALGGCGGESFEIGDVKVLVASNLLLRANPETWEKLGDEDKEALGYDVYKDYPIAKDWATALERLVAS